MCWPAAGYLGQKTRCAFTALAPNTGSAKEMKMICSSCLILGIVRGRKLIYVTSILGCVQTANCVSTATL